MITLPLHLRHPEADYVSILFRLLDIEFEDTRLISLMSEETEEELKQIFSKYLPVLNPILQVTEENEFSQLVFKIATDINNEYGSGFKWESNSRVEMDITQIIDGVIRDCLH